MISRLVILSSVLFVSACAVGPDHISPALPEGDGWNSSESIKDVTSTGQPVYVAWWENLNDTTLNTLITDAMAHNHDIRIALAKLDEARALRRVDTASFVPSISASASAERAKTAGNNSNNSFDAAIDAAWEPDLFGRVRRSVEASDARTRASEADYQDVMLGVLAEVARNYAELRGTQARIAITKRNVEVLREIENIAQSRLTYGSASEFEVNQARAERKVSESNVPTLEAEMMASIYRLSVLTGKEPEYYVSVLSDTTSLPSPPDIVPVGLPSDVLRRRPDVRRAEQNMAAASADIGVATSALFPRFPLTGSLGTNATTFGELFASGGFTYIVAQSIVAPIFEGGRLRAQIEAADARHKQTIAAYEKTIITALEDAETSLTQYGKEWQTLKALRAALTERKEAAAIAKARYESGSENFLTVLDAERSLLATQDALTQSETRILTRLTQLYKSLGGGWEATADKSADKAKEANISNH